ncbi:MAG: D-alanyl-D-alanine carboxypeptidase, partial [Bdellovibrionales bacterium]|nr:D-alanyl-D-alanine carboxypeptidase [Bdellovibrionales bacterium]
ATASAQKPIDIEYYLTKKKDLTVGLTSDAPSARIQNEQRSFIPASITKVITAAVALKALGPDFRFLTQTTYILLEPGVATDVVVTADGDPTGGLDLYDSGLQDRMNEIARALLANGITEIRGPITLLSVFPELEILTARCR